MKKIWEITNPFFRPYNFIRNFLINKSCEHKEWDMDNQIRTIKCRQCGKKAWVLEIKDLYKHS